jgi:hypothetical protein
VTLEVSFYESKPCYLRGAYGSSLQGESHSEENDDNGKGWKELFKLEEHGGCFEGYLEDTDPQLCNDQTLSINDDQVISGNDPSPSIELPTPTP